MTSNCDFQNGYSNFKFASYKIPLDWNKLAALDIDRIIATRDVKALVSKLDIVIKCNIDAEIKRIGFSEIFIKLFRLSQLGLEYLLHCKSFLENTLSKIEMEVDILKQEMSCCKRISIQNKKKKRSRAVLTADIENASFKCSVCKKVFVSDSHLKYHVFKHHMRQRAQPLLKGQMVDDAHDIAREIPCSIPQETYISDNLFQERKHVQQRDSPVEFNEELPSPKVDLSLNYPSNVALRLEELLTSIHFKDTFRRKHECGDTVKSKDSPPYEVNNSLLTTHASCSHSTQSAEVPKNGYKSNQKVSLCLDYESLEFQKSHESNTGDKLPYTILQNGPGDAIKNGGVNSAPPFCNLKSDGEIFPAATMTSGQQSDEFSGFEYSQTTGSESTSSSEEIDLARVRAEIENELEIKLRSMGIDPDWQKIPNVILKSNTARLLEIRKTYAHGDNNYYTLRNQLKMEAEKQLQAQLFRNGKETHGLKWVQDFILGMADKQ